MQFPTMSFLLHTKYYEYEHSFNPIDMIEVVALIHPCYFPNSKSRELKQCYQHMFEENNLPRRHIVTVSDILTRSTPIFLFASNYLAQLPISFSRPIILFVSNYLVQLQFSLFCPIIPFNSQFLVCVQLSRSSPISLFEST